MHERSSKPKRPRDLNQLAAAITGEATGDHQSEPKADTPPKNPHAAALGRLGGKRGGTARAKNLTPEQRHQIAKKAAAARWALRLMNDNDRRADL